MLGKKREEDLTLVFERRWKANHNDDVKEFKKRKEEFDKKMYGKPITYKPLSMEEKLKNMNKNIENLKNSRRF